MYLQLSTFGQQLVNALPAITNNYIPDRVTLGDSLAHFDSVESTSRFLDSIAPSEHVGNYNEAVRFFHRNAKLALGELPQLVRTVVPWDSFLKGALRKGISEAEVAHQYFRFLLQEAVHVTDEIPENPTDSVEDRFALQRLRFNGILGTLSPSLQAHVERVLPSFTAEVQWYEMHLDMTLHQLDKIWQQWEGPEPTTSEFIVQGAVGILVHFGVGKPNEIMAFGMRLLTELTSHEDSQ